MLLRTYDETGPNGERPVFEKVFFDNEIYTKIVAGLPIACVDVVPHNGKDAIYLAKRSIYPQKDWWIFGGRLTTVDETLYSGMQRKFTLETGNEFEIARFQFLDVNTYRWLRVAQGDFPGMNIAVTFAVEITHEERQSIENGLTPKEYEKDQGVQPFTVKRLVDENCHPALIDLHRSIFR